MQTDMVDAALCLNVIFDFMRACFAFYAADTVPFTGLTSPAVQLQELGLRDNQLVRTLPESWAKLTNVSIPVS